MNLNKNSYIISFASIMVIVVAALLALTSIKLTPFQDRNIELEKKQNILQSIGFTKILRDSSELPYSKYIIEEIVLDIDGNVLDGAAFDIDLGVELKKDSADQKLPLYVSLLDDGSKCYIIPLRGKGLWGPIWGYIALKEDINTVFGAIFAHKTETPGLGAEINQPFFQEPFKGKKIYNEENEFVSITVKKGGAPKGSMHSVDAISGGTITSDGVTEMIYDRVRWYLPYLNKNKPAINKPVINDTVVNDTIININLISKVDE